MGGACGGAQYNANVQALPAGSASPECPHVADNAGEPAAGIGCCEVRAPRSERRNQRILQQILSFRSAAAVAAGKAQQSAVIGGRHG